MENIFIGLTILAVVTNIFVIVINCVNLIESDYEEDRFVAFVLVLVAVVNLAAIVVNKVN